MSLVEKQHFVDLRSFGAIGFQDAPNGLWLGLQGYQPRSGLLHRIYESSRRKGVTVLGITTEDDDVVKNSPEDRFHFLFSDAIQLPHGYWTDQISANVCAVGNHTRDPAEEHTLYLVNAETVHAPQGADWKGLKLHAIGRNRLRKWSLMTDQARDIQDQGLPLFLANVGISEEAEANADEVIQYCTGIIGHDANNTFHPAWKLLPKVGRAISKYTTDANAEAVLYAVERGVPWIAVSSSHWMHQIGTAGFSCPREELPITPHEQTFLDDLRTVLEKGRYTNDCGYNSNLRVLQFGHLLATKGSAPDRFKGDDLSSYNATHV